MAANHIQRMLTNMSLLCWSNTDVNILSTRRFIIHSSMLFSRSRSSLKSNSFILTNSTKEVLKSQTKSKSQNTLVLHPNHIVRNFASSDPVNPFRHRTRSLVDFGILFDVDGVLARGSTPLDPAKKAMDKLKDAEGNLKVPVAFVTNACNRSVDKARQIGKWFDINVPPEQVIHAPTPAKLLRNFHDKHTLVIGQEHRLDIAEDLGFTNVCTIEDIKEAYPLLDMVDHANRVKVAKEGYTENLDFPKIDVILMIGEPCRWETDLQLLIDLLLTEGKPCQAPQDPHNVPQLPIIACNMDLVFMAEACMPRFGHGAFLLCLEALYQKITGRPLAYKNLVGKPCEITYRFAEHTVTKIARNMGISRPLKRLYFFGDNPSVDIVGANLYDRYIKHKDTNGNAYDLPVSRLIPDTEDLIEQTVEACHSMLVGTGVYKHKPEKEEGETTTTSSTGSVVYHGHRDIAHEPALSKPHKFVHDVHEGIEYILRQEGVSLA